jgi:uncharacterized protein YyaL (SSP411 family)
MGCVSKKSVRGILRVRLWLALAVGGLFTGAILLLILVATGLRGGSPEQIEAGAPPRLEQQRRGQSHRYTNHLAHETSPYLLQHAHNPVNWYPWGEEAFAKARKEDKPVFLSIGYSTCYWCHVMERESFENEEVTAILNEHFIAIKVDREERPDVDEQYMLATQLVTGRGGWPNSVWLTPDGRPWMAGTYFPRKTFKPLLRQLVELWQTHRDDLERQADQLAQAIRQASAVSANAGGQGLDEASIARAVDALAASFDDRYGGFGRAPKFPPHGGLRLLLHEIRRSPDDKLQRMATETLDAMWRGGIHDHVGGGFHRYATDERWFLPHFEKMLYDNAQLMRAYTDAYVLTGEDRYRQAVADIFRWLQREMTHPAGAFYTAIDSESEGEEGKFYVWSHGELFRVLGEEDAELFVQLYGFESAGNFVEQATGRRPGTNLPYLPTPIVEVAREKGLDASKLASELAAMREKLRAARCQRKSPLRDDKILTSWNGLMISALAHAGNELGESRYTQAAAQAAEFLLKHMIKDDTLLRTWRAGRARLPGYLTDYAFCADGLLELYEATGEERWLKQAKRLADALLTRFHDEENGGFYFTNDQHQDLIIRSKNLLHGGNIPSGNGVAAQVLLRLGDITGAQRYLQAAHRTLVSLSGFMANWRGGSEALILATAMLLDVQKQADEAAPRDHDTPTHAPVARYQIGPVAAELYSSHSVVRPGQTFHVAVKLIIDDGWHLYGPNAETASVIQTTLSPQVPDAVTAGPMELPEVVSRDDPVLGHSLNIYENEVWFRVPMTAAEDAVPGKIEVEFLLRTQACDQRRCLPPRTIKVKLPITVRSTSDDDTQHSSLLDESGGNDVIH